MGLDSKKIKELANQLGKREIEISPGILVDVLNEKYGKKSSGKPFTWSDIQQYYLRKKLPEKYGGLKLELLEGSMGKYVKIEKSEE